MILKCIVSSHCTGDLITNKAVGGMTRAIFYQVLDPAHDSNVSRPYIKPLFFFRPPSPRDVALAGLELGQSAPIEVVPVPGKGEGVVAREKILI